MTSAQPELHVHICYHGLGYIYYVDYEIAMPELTRGEVVYGPPRPDAELVSS